MKLAILQTIQMSSSQNQNEIFRRGQRNQTIHNSFVPEESVEETTPETFPEKPSYLKYTFFNPYNLTLFGGAIAASLLTLNPFVGLAALGLEGLWLLHGSQSRFMQRLLWDPLYEKEKLEFEQKKRLDKVQKLSEGGQERVLSLIEKEKQIQELAMQNPSFTGDLLRGEITKTHNLVNSFIDTAVTCARYENYLASVDVKRLDEDKKRWEYFVKNVSPKTDLTELDIAKKNLAVINKRIERVGEIRRYLKIAYGQINLIENSFQLLADQIVTMQSPNELSGQLDELLDGVESIKQTAQETEQILRTL